jgi:uncharacterized protein (TIRG00374 family)
MPIVAAVGLALLDRVLMAYRWVALLVTIEEHRRPPFGATMRVFFVSTFLGTFLPTSVGADAIRSYQMARLNVAPGDAVASVLMDRMLGVASVLLAALAGLWFARDLVAIPAIVVSLVATAAACFATLLVIFDSRSLRAAAWCVARVPFAGARRVGVAVLDSLRKYAAHPGPLIAVLAASIGVQILRIAQAYLLGVSLALTTPLWAYVAFIPLILLIIMLPITFNGMGTGQAAFVWFFARVGMPAAAAFTLSLLYVALGIVGNLPGALLYAWPSSDLSHARHRA